MESKKRQKQQKNIHLYLLCHSILVVLSGAKIKESKVHSFMSSSNLHLKVLFMSFWFNPRQFGRSQTNLDRSTCFNSNRFLNQALKFFHFPIIFDCSMWSQIKICIKQHLCTQLRKLCVVKYLFNLIDSLDQTTNSREKKSDVFRGF